MSNSAEPQLLDFRNQRPGRLYSVPKQYSGVGDEVVGLTLVDRPYVDREKMRARAVINTTAVDRDGEVIIPEGVRTENYAKNPVVMWGHGWEGISTPIAKCEHEDGSLALEIEPEAITAWSYFTAKTKESEQIFGLIDEGIVRATSIHVLPIEKRTTREGHDYGDDPVVVIGESEMLEFSWGAVGVNPEAVGKLLGRGRIAGSPISPKLKPSLEIWKSERRAIGKGWRSSERPEKDRKHRYTAAKVARMTAAELDLACEEASDVEERKIVQAEVAHRLKNPVATLTENDLLAACAVAKLVEPLKGVLGGARKTGLDGKAAIRTICGMNVRELADMTDDELKLASVVADALAGGEAAKDCGGDKVASVTADVLAESLGDEVLSVLRRVGATEETVSNADDEVARSVARMSDEDLVTESAKLLLAG